MREHVLQSQVVLGVPGLLEPEAEECTDEVCVTCSDEGKVAEVIAPAADGRSLVRMAEGEEVVDTMLVQPVEAGDLLLVHAGAALTRLGEGWGPR